MPARAVITGITGQDGSYLAELLLEKGYHVHGLVRRGRNVSQTWLDKLHGDPTIGGQRLFVHHVDLEDATTLRRIFLMAEPSEVYHLAGQSHVGLSFENPEATCRLIGMVTLSLLEILRDLPAPVRFFYASSSEIFGRPHTTPQSECTPMAPVNPYGCAKSFATQLVRVYRQSFGIHASSGILYNHESPRRAAGFVTQKICHAAAAISLGQERELKLGDLSARRDWGDARDYVRGMWLCLQQESADDYVFATGAAHSVKDVVEIAFAAVNLDWKQYVKYDESLVRPVEPHRLIGDATKARTRLSWEPRSSFRDLILEMTRSQHSRLCGHRPGHKQ